MSAPRASALNWTEAKRYLPLLALACLMALVLGMGWHRSLSLGSLVEHRDRLQGLIQEHWVLAPLAFAAFYATVVTLSLPGGAFCTVASGLLFGWLEGGAVAMVGASIGATIIFLIAKSALAETLRKKAGPWLAKLQDGFNQDALSYLLFLRLVPGFPFFVVNLVPALLGVPLKTYLIGTVFGIIPATFAFASIGAGLDSVIGAAKADFASCVAAKGAAACQFTINLSSLLTGELKLAFALLGIVALMPIVLKKWRSKKMKGPK